jgi:hypothetical protein
MNLMKIFYILSSLLIISMVSYAQVTWNMTMDVALPSYGNAHPRIVTNGAGDPLVLWNNAMNAMYSRWNGSSFTTPVALNPAPMPVAGASWMGPDIAAKGDTVYVVFKIMPEADTSSHIFLMRSFDGGSTFSTPIQVDQIGDSISRFPAVTVDDSGDPIVAFMKFDNAFLNSRWAVTRSGDFGSTFSPDIKVSGFNGSTAVCDCCPGGLASSGNNLMMLYRDNNNNIRDMWAGVSTDNGNSFSSGMPVDQNSWQVFSCSASGPDAVIAGDSIYTVYMSGANGSTRVYFSISSIVNLSGAIGNEITGSFPGLGVQNYPRIANDGSAMGIVWKQSVSGNEQAAMMFTNDHSTGFPLSYDTVDLGDVTNVDIAMSNGNIFVVWEDDVMGTVKFRSGTYNTVSEIAGIYSAPVSVTPTLTNNFIDINGLQLNAHLSITDAMGRTVINKIFTTESSMLSLEYLQNGMYFLTIENGNQKPFTTKIIKY